jgi:threonine dehydratase
MLERARAVVDSALVSTLGEISAALKLMVERNHIIAEGAGAASVAAALSGRAGSGKVVCVVSGGNIDVDKLTSILNGVVPG